MAAALLVAIGVAAALLLAQDQQTLRIRSSVQVGDSRFPTYLAHLVGQELTSGDAYVVHTNGANAFPAMLDAIRRAQLRIEFETYIYDSGTVGAQFTSALEAAARRGVQVRLVFDAIGSHTLKKADRERLERAGCRIGWVNPVMSRSIEEINYRSHRKALVVDGAVAFVGGMGVADQWMQSNDGMPAWRDTQIEIRGPAVADIEAAFDQNWILTGGVVEPRVAARESAPGQAESIVVWSAPQGGANGMKLLYLLALAAARREVDIESPYLITDASSQWSIADARRRGVRVRMVVDGDRTDAKVVKYASRAQYEQLLGEGVEIAEYQPTMMHAKTMVVDGTLSIVGSANFDNRSLELNDELNVAVFDPALAARLLCDFERDLAASKREDLKEWRSRPLAARGRDWVWSLFGEVF
jgi:cardiolipin synthase